MRKLGWITAFALVAIACSEPVGEMLIDAGEMMRDGGVADASTMPDGSIGGGGTTGSGGMATGGTTGSGGMATGGTTGSGGMATGGTSGSGGSPGADVSATCNKSETVAGGNTYYWAEFPINEPGKTEVTVCHRGNPDSFAHWKREFCHREIARWYEGTNTGTAYCGAEVAASGTHSVKSITVHN
jgi:hypothetical protein